ncbi:MAG: glycosyltransferase family 9 protein [Desulfomonilaceae bacterium]
MNIWIIRPGALGDTILTFPLLQSIKSYFDDALITLVGSSPYGDIVPAKFGFIPIDHLDLIWMFQSDLKIESTQSKPCEKAYVILKSPGAVVSNLRRAGVEKISTASPIPLPGAHLIETVHTQLSLATPPRIPMLNDGRRARTENILWAHPGSGGRTKLAPLQLFEALSLSLKQQTGCRVVITLGEADSHIKSSDQWSHWLEETQAEVLENQSLPTICNHMQAARFYIGNDSGISHLAAALGIFSILFFVTTDPVQWAPWAPSDQQLIFDCRKRDLNRDTEALAKAVTNIALKNCH